MPPLRSQRWVNIIAYVLFWTPHHALASAMQVTTGSTGSHEGIGIDSVTLHPLVTPLRSRRISAPTVYDLADVFESVSSSDPENVGLPGAVATPMGDAAARSSAQPPRRHYMDPRATRAILSHAGTPIIVEEISNVPIQQPDLGFASAPPTEDSLNITIGSSNKSSGVSSSRPSRSSSTHEVARVAVLQPVDSDPHFSPSG